MRDIKFRVWDGDQWSYFTIGQTMTAWMQAVYDDHCLHGRQFLQYTGLKDQKGEEIYNGDILKSKTGDIMKVDWDDMFASFVLDKQGWAFRHYFGEAVNPESVEIIGNIYENPELI